jgi:DNA processing protein
LGLAKLKELALSIQKKIVAYCGGFEAVFKEKQSILEKVPNVGPVLASQIKNSSVLSRGIYFLNTVSKTEVSSHKIVLHYYCLFFHHS